jgi:hypothetical protein
MAMLWKILGAAGAFIGVYVVRKFFGTVARARKNSPIYPSGVSFGTLRILMKFKMHFCLAAWLAGATVSFAQVPGGSPGGFNAGLTKLFGDVTAFSAKAEARVLDEKEKEIMVAPMDFALLDKKVRIQIDMTQAKSPDLTPETIGILKQQGLAIMISIVRPDLKLVYLIYPAQKSSLAMPMPKDQADSLLQAKGKVEKTALGKETIDGHNCVKNKVVVTDEKGQTLEATTWNAADMKDFPIQIRTTEQGNTSVIRFKDVKFSSPEGKQFDPPSGYTQYKDMQEMMQGIMSKSLTGAEKK